MDHEPRSIPTGLSGRFEMAEPTADRVTTRPDPVTPRLLCPSCERPLVYRQTVYFDDPPRRRSDYLECRTCGPFRFDHDTKTLRRVIDGA
jgi:hypothetical protein